MADDFDWHDSDLEDIPPTPPPIASPIQLPIRSLYRVPSEDPPTRASSEYHEDYDLPPPPTDTRFKTSEDGILHVNQFALENGYGVTIKSSRKDRRGTTKVAVYLQCDRSRPAPVRPMEQPRIRKTSTRSTACPFRAVLRRREGHTRRPWQLEITEPIHNHHPSGRAAHPVHRRRVIKQFQDDILANLEQGAYPRQVLGSLHRNGNSHIQAKDIYNLKDQSIAELLGGRSSIQALLDELPANGDWILRYWLREDDNSLFCLFAMFKTSIALLKANPYVLWMDCTFKTNRFKMPLLDITGCSCTGMLLVYTLYMPCISLVYLLLTIERSKFLRWLRFPWKSAGTRLRIRSTLPS
jgi:hypothetical protein